MNPSADPSEVDTASWRGQDLRLIPAAATAWLGTLSGLLGGWWITMLCGGAAAVLAIIAGVRARRTASRWVAGLGALAVLGVLTAGPVALRIRAAEQDDLRAAAARGSDATVRMVVTERPRPVRGAGYADRRAGTRLVVIAATVDAVVAEERAVDSDGRILLLAPAEGWTDLLPGQQVTASGRLAPAKGAELTVAVLSVRGPPSALGQAPWWQRAAESLRAGLRELCAVLPEEQAGLVPGLVVGDTSALAPRVEREFTDSGMSHLMAVSGGNVAIVCGSILLLLRALRIGPRTSAAVAAAGLAGFVVLAGPAPSVLRAGVMGAVGLLALALGRRGSALPALGFAVALLVVADPAMAADFGFALSVLATAGLVLLAPRWAEWLAGRGVPSGYAQGLAVPVAAFVMTAPVIAGMAGSVSLVSIITNVLAAPVVAPATVFGVLATVIGPWWPSAGRSLVRLTEPEASWLITVARHGARAPGAVVGWPGGWWGGLLAACLLVVLLVVIRLRHARILLAIALAGGLLVFVPVRVLAPAWPPASWSAVACDVGQGDAVVLATAEPGRAVLVDTGPEPGPVDDCLRRLGVERVPLIVLSHLHADHIGGLESVFEGRSVGAVAVGPGRAPAWAWRQVAEETARRGIPLLELGIGQRLEWPGLSLDVLGPRYVTKRSVREQDGTVINNGSVVLRAGTPAGRVLLTGDVELAAQADLLAEGIDLRAEVLKVPHHGSRYTAPDFLNAVAPRAGLVSVGAGNPYGHPNKSTLDNLAAVGASIARTDTDGDTAVVTDARGLALQRRGEPRGPPRS